MDWVLLAVVVFYFFKGCWRGFAEIMFSILSTLVVFMLSYKFCQPLGELLEGLKIFDFQDFISNILNVFFEQSFSSVDELATAVNSSGTIFKLFLSKIVLNIDFDGKLTAGEILSPTINALVFRVVAFLIIFISVKIVLSLIKVFIFKLLKICKHGNSNRLLGGLVGIVQGLVAFAIIYIILSSCANVFLNEKLLQFCQSGEVSNFIYQNFIQKIISLF